MNEERGSRHLHNPVELSLDQCIKCNICITACPVSAVTDLFPGPKYEAPQGGRFRSSKQKSPDRSVDYCSGCRVCNMVCPTGVNIAEMNARARAAMVEQNMVPVRLRVRNNLIARTELIGKLGQPLAPLANAFLANRAIRQVAESVLGIHRKAPLPTFSKERFSRWFHRRENQPRSDRKVVYFHGCSTEYYEPWVGKAVVFVLETNGFEVILPDQNCCGLPLLSNGEFGAARAYHENNVGNLLAYARQGIPIVGTSTSCTLTLKEEALELLDMHDPNSLLVAKSTYDINEFLLELYYHGLLKTDFKPVPYQLPYHAPCQYRAHRIGRPALDVLAMIPELQILDSHAACCGIAGTYGYKKEKYDISMAVGEDLFDFVHASDAPLAICDSETCRWQITHATGLPAVHPIELLAYASGFEVEGDISQILH